MEPILARDLMTKQIYTVSPSTGLREVVEFLRENQVHAAVVEESSRLVGVVSYSDVVRYLADESEGSEHHFSHIFLSDGTGELEQEYLNRLDEARAIDVMTPVVFECDGDATAGAAAAYMAEQGVHRVVVTEGGRAVGVLSATDLLPVVAKYEKAVTGAPA